MSSHSGEEEEIQRECCVCKEIPENIICLSCSHCICLSCAAQKLIEKEEPTLEELECPLCFESTLLSEEIQYALIKLFQDEGLVPDSVDNDTENEIRDNEDDRNLNGSASSR